MTNTSELTVCRNIFYDCDHMLLVKENASAVVQNNTVVKITTNALGSQPPAVINFSEANRGTAGGSGAIVDGNIFWDVAGNQLALNYSNSMFLTVARTILPATNWPGVGNSTNDPMFVNVTNVLNVTNDFRLLPGSPAIGAGPNGLDIGALVPGGASISGEPPPETANTSAFLSVGGPGVVAYKWRLNDGTWSEELPLTNNILYNASLFADALPITLTNLTNGTYAVEVIGKNSAGTYQSIPTISRTWTVEVPPPPLLVGGKLTNNTRWDSAAGEVHVISTVIVPKNTTLSIAPGTTIRLTNDVFITAEAGGRIEIDGRSTNKIRFMRLSGTNNWGGLMALGTDASLTIRHAEIVGGQVAVFTNAAALVEDSDLHDYRVFTNPDLYNQPMMITEHAGSVTVRRCHFREYHETLFRYGVTVIEDSLFEEIHGDGIDFDFAVPGSVIRRCTLRHGNGTNIDAVDIGSLSRGVLIEECLMYDFPFDKGVSIGEHSEDITVRNCVIYSVESGVAVKDSSVASIYSNTFVSSDYGLRLYEKIAGQGGGHATAYNNIIWSNTNSISLANGSTISVNYSDISGALVYPGTNNVNVDPIFLDTAQSDYRLASNSPCLDLGLGGTTLGALLPPGSLLVDTDDDGLPDPWEWGNELDFNNSADFGLDADGDGRTNFQEYLSGTDPQDATSYLKFETIGRGVDSVAFQFTAVAGKSYSVEYRNDAVQGLWLRIEDVVSATTNRVVTVTDTISTGKGMRLYSPADCPE